VPASLEQPSNTMGQARSNRFPSWFIEFPLFRGPKEGKSYQEPAQRHWAQGALPTVIPGVRDLEEPAVRHARWITSWFCRPNSTVSAQTSPERRVAKSVELALFYDNKLELAASV
jgi:hypothetical protein